MWLSEWTGREPALRRPPRTGRTPVRGGLSAERDPGVLTSE